MVDSPSHAFAPAAYAVTREAIRAYALAVGEGDPRAHDLDAARAAGLADLLAPPMFAVVYAGQAIWPALTDPSSGIDFARLVHGAQAFRWHAPVVAGDEITTRVELAERGTKGPLEVFAFASRSTNGRGELTCEGTWTNFVRGADA